jgi:hypothetical protein
VFDKLAAKFGTIVVVVDRPASIGALPLTVAQGVAWSLHSPGASMLLRKTPVSTDSHEPCVDGSSRFRILIPLGRCHLGEEAIRATLTPTREEATSTLQRGQ